MEKPSLTQNEIDSIMDKRGQKLQLLQPVLSKKFYYKLEKRLEEEKEQWYDLLNIASKKQAISAKYSHILDSFYFQQKLMN